MPVPSLPTHSARKRGWSVVAAGTAVGLVCLMAACTPAPSTQPASPSAPATVSSAATEEPSSPSASGSQSANALTIDITIADGKVTPNAEKIDVVQGTTVRLNVNSDQDDEIHAHTAGNGYELEVKAGQPATGSFVAADTGSFEIESHHLDKVIAILNVH